MGKQPKAKFCKNCSNPISEKAAACPVCGAKYKKPFYRQAWFLVLAVIVVLGWPESINDSADEIELTRQEQIQHSENDSTGDNKIQTSSKPSINQNFDISGYNKIDAQLLFDYGCYMKNEKVVTVITLADISKGLLKANTENNDSFFFSIVCELQDDTYLELLQEGDKVTIAGTVTEETISLGDTVTLEDCSVVGLGEIENEITEDIEGQRQLVETLKAAHEKAEEDAARAEKDNYINLCETVNYSDVERNPDDYDGKKVMVSGEVIQVSEGWFDTVTMRIDSQGNIWYVTYVRPEGESRVLEGDSITCYGECDGVTSYTTVLGAQVTIPSMRMEYYS